MTDLFEKAERANEFIRDKAKPYGEMVATREDLDEALKVTEARLMNECPDKAEHQKKAYARSHADYKTILDGRKAAREEEIKLRYHLQAAQNQFEMWRSWNSANKRGA